MGTTTMADSKHTPGPWTYVARNHQIRTVDELSSPFSGELISSVSPLNPEMPYNGFLIAAAPDLLEALRGFLAAFPLPLRKDEKEAIEAAKTAIAKAEGRA